MPIILATDTSTSINTVAVCRDGALLAEIVVQSGRRHAERLMALTATVLQEAGLTLRDVDALAVSIGPGSFTGLRIGVSAWKGLALGAQKPLVAVPTLDAMARLVSVADGWVCPLTDARMKEVYGAVYQVVAGERTCVIPPCVCPVEDVLAHLPRDIAPCFLGDGAYLYRDRIIAAHPGARFLDPSLAAPRASAVAAEAEAMLAAGTPTTAALVSPVYLRPSQAEQLAAGRAAQAATA
jgi:tRNA threonylcarbamoyladenosine biosynthesis protein TsaB